MSYKKRPKNKQELSSKSGKRTRKELPKKTIIEFQFVTQDGKKYGLGTGRIKVMDNGGISCLIPDEEGKWIKVKAKVESVKLKTVIIKKETKKK